MPAAAFRRQRRPRPDRFARPASWMALGAVIAALAGGAATGARAQDGECYRARSHVTGERVWVCRGARGQWQVAPEGRRLPRLQRPSVARPAPPAILDRPAEATPPPPRLSSGREGVDADRETAAAIRADNLALQNGLNAVGCEAGRPDGVWGAQSRRAARCFQRSVGAPPTGRLTDDQVDWLRDLANGRVAGLDSSALERLDTPHSGAAIEDPENPPDGWGDDGTAQDRLAQDQLAQDQLAQDPSPEELEEDLTDDSALADAPADADPAEDPVGLPELRIDVSKERDAAARDAAEQRAADPTGQENMSGLDAQDGLEAQDGLDDARDPAEAVAEVWRSDRDRLASVLSDGAPAPKDPPAQTDAAGPDATRPETPRAPAEQETVLARKAEIARLAPMLGLDPADLRDVCRQGMRERQDEITPMVVMFNRVCRAHAYAVDDEMLKLGYDARLAAAGDREAELAMEKRRKAAEAARAERDAARPKP